MWTLCKYALVLFAASLPIAAQAKQIGRISPGFTIPTNGGVLSSDGDWLAVGDPDSQPMGEVHIYQWDGADWLPFQVLAPTNGEVGEDFGATVSVSQGKMVVGAPSAPAGGVLRGAAYMFLFDGTMWVQTDRLLSPTGDDIDVFGYFAVLDGDTACIGSPNTATFDAGQMTLERHVWIYTYDGTSWGPPQVVTVFEGSTCCAIPRPFGLDLDGDWLGVWFESTPSTEAFIRMYEGPGWTLQDELYPKGNVAFGGATVLDLDIDEDVVAVGGPELNGYCEIYRNNAGIWSLEQLLVHPDLEAANGVRFGRAVALEDGALTIGSGGEQFPGFGLGAAYVYRFVEQGWSLEDRVQASDFATAEQFGHAVDMTPERAFVAARDRFSDVARFYVYDLDKDTDGDGLPDSWEINGIPQSDGNTYVLPNADFEHKDLYLEVDAMDEAGLAPAQAVLDRVAAVFANAPVVNPDGVDGITLHTEFLESNLPTTLLPNMWTEFEPIKQSFFGSPAERGMPNSAAVLQAKAMAFRYCLFAKTHSGGSNISGFAELWGNDLVVTLGGPNWAGGTDDHKAGTLLHELGHTLGLEHGGADSINFKPNYYGGMNQQWQMPMPWQTPGSWPFDYSRVVLPTLREDMLDETVGLDPPAGAPFTGFKVPYNSAVGAVNRVYATMSAGTAVDWNGNGMIDSGLVAADLNRVHPGEPDSQGQILRGHNDWLSLSLGFRAAPSSANGVHSGLALDEMSYEDYQVLIAFEPPVLDFYCQGKLNSDGCVPSIGASGTPSATDPNPFFVTASDVVSNTIGFLRFGSSPNQAPFLGGFLCVDDVFFETPLLSSGGSGPCGGSFSYEVNAAIQASPDPLSLIGFQGFCQYLYLDGQSQGSFGATNALRMVIQP